MSLRFEELRIEVCAANRALREHRLVTLTWGNVSGIDRDQGVVAIKPSGVPYEDLAPEHIVCVDLEGQVVDGDLRPSSDTPTHIRLYRGFESIGGVAHTHSRCATMFAQARRGLPCLGTTHADHFFGTVPVARPLTKAEVATDYEGATGEVILEQFRDQSIDPVSMPAVLVAGHAPFTWGPSAKKALENAVALEAVADMAIGTWHLDERASELEAHVLGKHYQRKHGKDAYYGQG